MDEKKGSDNSKQISRESDEKLSKAPNSRASTSTQPAWESPVSANTGGHIEEEEGSSVSTGGGSIEE